MLTSVNLIFKHSGILLRVTVNELKSRHVGSILGVGWMILSPMLILTIYAVVYLFIFRIRPVSMEPVQYVLYIFAGLVPFFMFSQALTSGVASVVTNRAVLRNTMYPVDLVPVQAVLSAQSTQLVGFTIVLLSIAVLGLVHWTLLLVPILWILELMFLIGSAWILSLLNIVVRDLQYMISIILMAMLISAPIAYTPDMIPTSLKVLMYINPFAYFVIAFQKVIILGLMPTPAEIGVLVVMSVGIFVLGSALFTRGKRVLIDYV